MIEMKESPRDAVCGFQVQQFRIRPFLKEPNFRYGVIYI